ncbi:hypothetical protein GKD14_12890 [Paeniclostridium sordellii]|nr:hypothetical protein [Paeniclostridium sordellii]MSB59840.1 hypothetical protein [Paeniclostridium sordellii]
MKIKLYKKLAIILTISLGIFGMVGCELSSKVGNLNNVVSEKLYTTDDIKKEIKTSVKHLTSESLKLTMNFLGNSNFTRKDLSKFRDISKTIENDKKVFEEISTKADSKENKDLVSDIVDSYKKVDKSINKFIDEVQIDEENSYAKSVNDICVEIGNVYNTYKSIK